MPVVQPNSRLLDGRSFAVARSDVAGRAAAARDCSVPGKATANVRTNTSPKVPRKSIASSVEASYSKLTWSLGSNGVRAPEGLLSRTGARWLFGWMQQLFSRSEQSRELSGALLEHYVSSRILRRQPEAFSKSGEQDDRKHIAPLTNFGDEFQTIHRGHPVIRDDQVDCVFFQHLECFAAATGGEHLVSQFLKNGLASRIAVGIVVNQQNPCWFSAAAGGGRVHRETCEINKREEGVSTHS